MDKSQDKREMIPPEVVDIIIMEFFLDLTTATIVRLLSRDHYRRVSMMWIFDKMREAQKIVKPAFLNIILRRTRAQGWYQFRRDHMDVIATLNHVSTVTSMVLRIGHRLGTFTVQVVIDDDGIATIIPNYLKQNSSLRLASDEVPSPLVLAEVPSPLASDEVSPRLVTQDELIEVLIQMEFVSIDAAGRANLCCDLIIYLGWNS